MAENLKQQAISGMIWSSIGKFGTLIIRFLCNLVLARLLDPEHWGCIGMLMIFIGFSETFISGGLGAALVQRKDVSRIDYTTVFYYNLAVATFFIVVLFFAAPYIAKFYEIPLLCSVLRVQSIHLIFRSFAIVPANQLQKEMKFKSLNIRSLIASFISAVAAIAMAYFGFGVWALVAHALVYALVSTMLLWKMSTWRPTLEFSMASFKSLFSYGGIILISNLAESLFYHLQGLIIGKMYSPSTLGYYTQARNLETIPTSALSNIVQSVSFPLVSKIQDDANKVIKALRIQYRTIIFLNFPIMVLLFVAAEPLILFLYGEKWLNSVFYLRILCFGGLMYNISTLSTSTIKALGKAKEYLCMQLTKRGIALTMITLGALHSHDALIYSIVVNQYIYLVINNFMIRRFLPYKFVEFLKDILPTLAIAVVSAIPAYYLNCILHLPNIVMLLIIFTVYAICYILLAYIFKLEAFNLYWEIVKTRVFKVFKKKLIKN